jgi:chromosome segregation ATPase
VTRIQSWHAEKIKITESLDKINENLKKEEKILKNHKNQKKSIDNAIKSIKDEISNIELNINDLFHEQSELSKKLKQNQEFIEEFNKIMAQKETYEKQIQENKKDIANISNEIKQIFQSLTDIDHKFDNNKWFLEDPAENSLKKLDIAHRKLTNKRYSYEHKKEELERERYKKINKLKLLQESLRKRIVPLPPKSNIKVLKEEIKRRELNAKGPIIEYLKYDDHLSYAIESILGESLLFSFIVPDWSTLTLIKKIRDQNRVRCNIYLNKEVHISQYPEIDAKGVLGYLVDLIDVLGNDQDIKKVLYSKIRNCLVIEDYRYAEYIYTRLNFKGRCVTLKGQQIRSYQYTYETPYIRPLKGFLST